MFTRLCSNPLFQMKDTSLTYVFIIVNNVDNADNVHVDNARTELYTL